MTTDSLKKAGIRFDYCCGAVAEIPYVQDVLYALRLSEQQLYYSSGYELYIANVHLAAAACGRVVMFMQPYDEAKARIAIAISIVDLCPEDARCLFNSAFMEARMVAGLEVPPSSAGHEQLMMACTCSEHRRIVRERHRFYSHHEA